MPLKRARMKVISLLIFSLFLISLNTLGQENYLDPEYKFHGQHFHDIEPPTSRASRSAFAQDYDVHHATLYIAAEPPAADMKGTCTMTSTSLKQLDTIWYDFTSASSMRINLVQVNGTTVTNYLRADDKLIIPLANPINADTQFQTLVDYEGSPSGAWGFYYSGTFLGSASFWTKSEPYGSKHWWPAKMDLLDKLDSIDIFLEHPSNLKGTTAGVLVSETQQGSKTIEHWKHNYPIVNYLVAVAIGDYWVKESTLNYSGQQVEMVDYLYTRDSAWYQQSRAQLQQTFVLFDSLFGVYPFINEKYGHTQFSRGGGMEHQTNSWMRDLNQPLVAHELAHQWFGNKITCGSWQDLWLNEGFATYLTALTYEAGFGDIDWMTWKKNTIGLVGNDYGSVWREDTVNTSRLFSWVHTYNKGALLLHALRYTVGDAAFFQGVRNYIHDPKLTYSFARTEDLKQHIEASSGQDLTEFFNDWFYGQNCPTYRLVWKINGSHILFDLEQTMNHAVDSFFEMNVPIAVYKDGVRQDFIFPFDKNGMQMSRYLGYFPDSVEIDPDWWICTANRTVIEGTHQSVSVAEEASSNQTVVFPNPSSNGKLSIQLGHSSDAEIQLKLYDLMGALVLERSIPEGSDSYTLHVEGLPAGTYQLMLKHQEHYERHKVVVN